MVGPSRLPRQRQNSADEATAGDPIWLARLPEEASRDKRKQRLGRARLGHMRRRCRIRTDDKRVNIGYLNVFYAQVTSSVRRRGETQRNLRRLKTRQRAMASNRMPTLMVHWWTLVALLASIQTLLTRFKQNWATQCLLSKGSGRKPSFFQGWSRWSPGSCAAHTVDSCCSPRRDSHGVRGQQGTLQGS
jgi:hypothetical protein